MASFNEMALAAQQSSHGPFLGPVDIIESRDAIVFKVDTPGLTKNDVKVRISEGTLMISGERAQEKLAEGSSFHRMERSFGKFNRSFKLPDTVDILKVAANCDHGVLIVSVPKKVPDAVVGKDVTIVSGEEEGDGSLNSDFENVPISVFPTPALGKLIVIDSDMSILDAVKLLSKHHILAAPVRDATKPADASWSEKYLGFLDMVGIVLHMLETLHPDGKEPEDFDKEIETVDAFRQTKVADAVRYPRFSQFIPVEHEKGNLLDAMLLCGQHGIRRVPVVKTPGGDLTNIVTQSALVQTLAANLDRFQKVGKKTLLELGLGSPSAVFTVTTEDPLKKAFHLIKEKDVSAIPVVDAVTGAIRGNISARDVRLIVNSNKIYKLLNMPIRVYLDVVAGDSQENSAITCLATDTMETVVNRMVQSRIHRIYVVDAENKPVRVVALRNVLRKFVKEPAGYFGHFFDH